jgi:hypothetical protein
MAAIGEDLRTAAVDTSASHVLQTLAIDATFAKPVRLILLSPDSWSVGLLCSAA